MTWISTYYERMVVSTGELTISIATLVQLIRFTNAAYTATMIVAKLSIGVFFLKLFTRASFNWQRYTIMAMMGVSTAFGLVYLIMTFATCGIMVQSQKTTALHTGSDWCPIQDAFVNVSIAYSVLNIVTDVAFTVLAIIVLWGAKMDRMTKVTASVLLAVGSVGCIASIMRVVIQTPLSDIRLAGVLLGLWSVIEAGMCITAASLITLRPLVQPVIEKARSSLSSISKGSRDDSAASSPSSSPNISLVKSNVSHEMYDLERGNKSAVLVTRTFEIREKDSDSWSQQS